MVTAPRSVIAPLALNMLERAIPPSVSSSGAFRARDDDLHRFFSAGVVAFDAVCASLPPDRVARTATTTTTTKNPPVSTSASRIGLKPGRFRISQAPNQSHIRLSTLSQANNMGDALRLKFFSAL